METIMANIEMATSISIRVNPPGSGRISAPRLFGISRKTIISAQQVGYRSGSLARRMSVQCIRFFGIEIAIGIKIDAVGRLILTNLVASSAETAEHRGHPVE